MKKSVLVIAALLVSSTFVMSQDNKDNRVPLIGSEAPAFKAISTNGEFNFPADFGKNWKIIFSHPKDFTPVCSSELLELAHQQQDYEKLGANIVVISTDVLDSHISWKTALEGVSYKGRQPVKINFPLIEDNSMKISNSYGMIHSPSSVSMNIRGVFFIDPENKVRAIQFYPMEVGRNMDEIKRTLIALQTNYNKHVILPANWQPGNDVMLPFVSEDELAEIGTPGSNIYQTAWFMTFKKSE
jgi:peroxiredoxin (alkyl hydroperoxide reductase subunit C)